MIIEVLLIVSTVVLLYNCIGRNYCFYLYYKFKGVAVAQSFTPFFGEGLIRKKIRDQKESFDHKYLLPTFNKNPKTGMIYADIKGMGQNVFIGDPKVAQEAISMVGVTLEKTYFLKHFFKRLFPKAFFLLPTAGQWKQRRECCIPGLSLKYQKLHMKAFEKSVEIHLAKLRARDGEETDMVDLSNRMANEAFGEIFLGPRFRQAKVSWLENGIVTNRELSLALSDSIIKGINLTMNNFCHVTFPILFNMKISRANKEHDINRQRIHQKLRELMLERKMELNSQHPGEDLVADPFIKSIDDETYNVDQATADIYMLVFGGQISASYVLTVFLYRIHKHPDILSRLLAEIKEKILEGEDNICDIDKHLTFEKLKELSLLSMCIKECLRIDHPAADIPYVAKEDILLNGIKVHQGMNVVVQLALLHYNQNEWQSPKEFIPERFDPNSNYYKTPTGEKRHPLSYSPFLFGPRNCVGQNIATTFLKYTIVKMLSSFKFELSAEHLQSTERTLDTGKDSSLPMKVSNRASLSV